MAGGFRKKVALHDKGRGVIFQQIQELRPVWTFFRELGGRGKGLGVEKNWFVMMTQSFRWDRLSYIAASRRIRISKK